jgi:RND family efflux transporter MFP subunit
MDYSVEQPASVHAYETVPLHAQISGFLKTQDVDIGDRVKRGEVLAVIAVPELDKQLQRNQASLARARAGIKQAQARIASAKADRDAAKAAVAQANATDLSAAAWVRFRSKEYLRMKDLFASGSVEERSVDESKERHEASLESERSAKAAIATTNAKLVRALADITRAEADLSGAISEVAVAQADIEKTQVLLDFTLIRAPFDGEISFRAFFPGDFIRSAGEGSGQQPLLTVQRTDLFRVVVRLPETFVPFLDKGDLAIVRIDSLPGKKFAGKVSRKSGTADTSTRLMRVEVDLPNPTGELGDGMYGNVKIILDRFPNLLSIPLSSAVKTVEGRSAVYVIREGRAQLTEVRLGKDNGTRVTILSGLRADDQVVREPRLASIVAGTDVESRLVPEPPATVDEP